MDTLVALRSFHAGERRLFERLLNLGKDPYVSKKIMALWLWLESVGHYDLLEKIQSHPDRFLLLIAAEAETCLACLQNTIRSPFSINDDIAITSSLVEQPIILSDFEQRDIAVRGISHILNGVCALVFDDIIARRGICDASQILVAAAQLGQVRHFGEGSSRYAAALGGAGLTSVVGLQNPWCEASHLSNVPRSPVRLFRSHTSDGQGSNALAVRPASHIGRLLALQRNSHLNPMARPWAPEVNPAPEEERCMFVTFSRGHSLSRGEIIDFFTQNWGDCVDNVYVESPTTNDGPLYGRVIFRTRAIISHVLNGEEKVKFSVHGRPLWGRMYRPRRGSS